ncbi:MAG: protein-tyrosine phosphatase family protein [Thermoanaerobaculia bacterium]
MINRSHLIRPRSSSWLTIYLAVAAGVLLTACNAGPRPFDAVAETGFAVYRSGKLSAEELESLCHEGVSEMVILDGTGGRRECEMRQRLCPQLRIRYSHPQDAGVPLTAEFLGAFDRWVEDAQSSGTKLAFRCHHGWHRAGRLAAYYRMKFDGWSAEEAIAEMDQVGGMMWQHPYLEPQVEAMSDLIAGRPCGQGLEYCVQSAAAGQDEGLSPLGLFVTDVCSPPTR